MKPLGTAAPVVQMIMKVLKIERKKRSALQLHFYAIVEDFIVAPQR